MHILRCAIANIGVWITHILRGVISIRIMNLRVIIDIMIVAHIIIVLNMISVVHILIMIYLVIIINGLAWLINILRWVRLI